MRAAGGLVVVGAVGLVAILWQSHRCTGGASKDDGDRGGPEKTAGLDGAERCTVLGSVAGGDGAVSGSLVTFTDRREGVAQETRTDGAGMYVLHGIRAGVYEVAVSSERYLPSVEDYVFVRCPVVTHDVRVEVGGYSIRGVVLDAGGGAVPGASVVLQTRGDGGWAQQRVLARVLSDGQGAFGTRARGGAYRLVVRADGYAEQGVDLVIETDMTLELRLLAAGTISGVVRNGHTGIAAEGAHVWANAQEGSYRGAIAVSGSDGAYTLANLEPGRFDVIAVQGGLTGVARAIIVESGEVSRDVVVELTEGGSLAGIVVDHNGGPVAGAEVLAGPSGLDQWPWRGTTGGDGAFAFAGIPSVQLRILVRATGFASAHRVLPASGPRQDVRIVLDAATAVEGVVRDRRGGPVAGAIVSGHVRQHSADSSVASGGFAQAETDDQGVFAMSGLGAGELRVEAWHDEHGLGRAGPITLRAGESEKVEIVLGAGSYVSGTVRWSTGEPATGVTVMASKASQGALVHRVETHAGARYRIGPLEPGTLWVWGSTPRDATSLQRGARFETVVLRENEDRSGVDLVLEAADGSIAGTVIDHDGSPIAGAIVGATREFAGPNSRLIDRSRTGNEVQSQGDGEFVIEGLAGGTYTVWALHAAMPEGRRLGIPTGSTGVKVVLEDGALLAGEVVDGQGRPVRSYHVSALPAPLPSEPPERTMLRRWGARLYTEGHEVHDAAGRFELRGLHPDTYDLVVLAPAGLAGRLGGVAVAAGEERRGLRIVAQAGRRLAGRVVDAATRSPIANAEVTVQLPGSLQSHTRADGTFLISGVPDGEVAVWVFAGLEHHIPDTWAFAHASGPQVDVGELALLPGTAHSRPATLADIGVSGESLDRRLVVSAVDARGSGADAGIFVGEVVLRVDDLDVSALGGGALRYLLRGEPGTVVRLDTGSRSLSVARRRAR